MLRGRIALVCLCTIVASSAFAELAQAPPAADCSEWRECQRLALAAAERGEYETFHDLAWRAVQKGPRNDPALMFMLARAQSLSGRPHDAIVMLERIAQISPLAPDTIAIPDFERARQLPAWADLEAQIDAGTSPPNSMLPPEPAGARPAPASPPATPTVHAAEPVHAEPAAPTAASTGTPKAAPSLPGPVEAVRFSAAPFSVGGVAYDAVSQRFLLGDRHGRKLIVVGDRSDHSVDLARADASGFREIAAIEIDPKRGDLWVASAGDADGTGYLHKLQLISGRTLKTFPISAPDDGAVRPADLAVTRSGSVLVLDAGQPRLLILRPGQNSVERMVRIKEPAPSSIAVGDEDEVAYVAHGGGISRVNLRTGSSSAVPLPATAPIGRVECLRWYRHGLIEVEQREGSRRIVRLTMNDRGTSVTRRTTIAENLAGEGRLFAAISGDDLVYVVTSDSDQPAVTAEEFVLYRLPLQ